MTTRSKAETSTGRRRLPRKWRDAFVGLLLVCFVATLAQWARTKSFVQEMEWSRFSQFSKARNVSKYAEPIEIVEVDEEAYDSFDYKIPTPRDYLARLITRVCDAKPKAIGLDYLLDRPIGEKRGAEDDALAAALRTARERGIPVVIACDPDPGDGGPAEMPIYRFAREGILGHIDVEKGGSGAELRAIDWLKVQNGKTIPSFAGALAALELNVRPGQINDWLRARVEERGRYAGYIDFDPATVFNFMPSGDADPRNPMFREDVAGKLVLIGAHSALSDDSHPTPLQNGRFAKGIMPGIYVQAYALQTMLAPSLKAPSSRFEWLMSAVAAGLFLALLYRLNATRAFLVGGATLILGVVAALYIFARTDNFYAWMWLLNVGPALIAVFACALGWWIRRQMYLYACFGTFFSKPVLRGISSVNDLSDVKPTTGTATVMFCDLIGFSKVCRRLSPEQALAMANHYLNPIAGVVERSGGLLEKFLGDGCLAYFGAPLPGEAIIGGEVSALQAAKAGLEIQIVMERLRAEAKSAGMPELQMSVGLHTGPLSAGLVGARPRVQFTVIGDTVNDAARVESFGHLATYATPLRTRVMASEATARHLEGHAVVEEKLNAQTEKYSGRIYEVESILNGKA